MVDEPDKNKNEGDHDWLKQTLKAIGLVIVGLLLLVVIVFGLLVGFCALAR